MLGRFALQPTSYRPESAHSVGVGSTQPAEMRLQIVGSTVATESTKEAGRLTVTTSTQYELHPHARRVSIELAEQSLGKRIDDEIRGRMLQDGLLQGAPKLDGRRGGPTLERLSAERAHQLATPLWNQNARPVAKPGKRRSE